MGKMSPTGDEFLCMGLDLVRRCLHEEMERRSSIRAAQGGLLGLLEEQWEEVDLEGTWMVDEPIPQA